MKAQSMKVAPTIQLLILAVCFVSVQPGWSQVWQQRGPEGGNVAEIAVDPASPSTAFAVANRSVYRTNDAGNTWLEVTGGITNFVGLTVAIDPQTTDTIYVGGFGGVFKSVDGGASWNQVNAGLTTPTVNALRIDPLTPTTVFAGTNGGGVFKSTNGGVTWSPINAGLTNLTVNAVAVNPQNPNVIYAGTAFNASGGVFRSADGGATWSVMGNAPMGALSLAIDPVSPTTLYAGWSAVYKSTDGVTWGAPFFLGTTYSLAVDPATPATVFAGGANGAWKTTDAGTSWNVINTGLTDVAADSNNRINTLAINPVSPDILYAGLRGAGVFKTTDGGTAWAKASVGMFSMWLPAIAVDPVNPGTVYAAANGAGVFKSVDSGSTWSDASAGLTILTFTKLAVDPVTPTTLYVGTSNGSMLLKSTDGGGSWNPLSGLPGGSRNGIVIDPSAPDTIYVATFSGPYKSTDGGASWNPANGGLASFLRSLAIDPLTPATLYAGTNSGLYKTTDGGSNWVQLTSGLPNDTFPAIAVNPVTTSVVYAGTGGVYKSTDGGATWNPTTLGGRVRAVEVDPHSPSTVYAATSQGVFTSMDAGATWDLSVARDSRSLAVDPSSSAVYAGTGAFSTFVRAPIPSLTVTEVAPTTVSPGGQVAITGSGFSGPNLSVLFDGLPGENVQVVSDGTLTANVPLSVSGAVDISVSTDQGSAELLGALTVLGQATDADLEVTILTPDQVVIAGSTVDFDILVSNNGPSTATNVILEATFTGFADAQALPANCTRSSFTQPIFCNIASLAPTAADLISFTMHFPAAGLSSLTASAAGEQLDPVPANNQDAISIAVQNSGSISLAAGLSVVSGANDLGHVLAGSEVSLLATITNFGPSFATQTVVEIGLPSGSQAVSGPGTCSVAGRTVTCSGPDLPPPVNPSNPTQAEIPFSVTFSSPGNVTTTVSAIQTDPFPADDVAVVWIDVRDRVSDLRLSATGLEPVTVSYEANGTPVAGLAIDLSVQNEGPERTTIESIEVSINRPNNVSRIEVPWVSSIFQCSQTVSDSAVTLSCQPNQFEILPFSSVDGTLRFEVDALGGYRADIKVVPSSYDPNLSNNDAVGLAAAVDTPETSVRAIEVTQAVQDWQNSVPLIAGKDTVVRGFVELLPGEADRVASARLVGTRDGSSLGPPLVPVNSNTELQWIPNIVSRRVLLEDSFNFRLPSTWTVGTIQVELQVYDDMQRRVPVVCNVPGRSSCSVEVFFVPSQQLTVKLFPVVWGTHDDSNTPNDLSDDTFANVPTPLHLFEQALRLRAAFPLATPTFEVGEALRYAALPSIGHEIDEDLKVLHDLEEAGNFCGSGNCGELHTRYYGYFIGSSGDSSTPNPGTGRAEGKVAGGSIIGGNEISWTGAIARAEDPDGVGYARNRIAHEIAHTLEITHTADPQLDPKPDGDLSGACGSSTDSDRLFFPTHATLSVSAGGTPVPGGRRFPVLGPIESAGVDDEVWGFDTRYVDSDTSRSDAPRGHAVIDPRQTWPMMSYCKDGGAQGRWVSAWNYDRLIGSIANPSSEGSGDNGGDGDYLLLSGVLSADGSVFEPRNPIEFSGNPFLLDSAGTFRAVLRSSSGQELEATNFEPSWGVFDGPEPEAAAQTRLVTVILPKPTEPIGEIAFLNGAVEISRTTASPTTPSVVILRPARGDLLDSDIIRFEWLSLDPDGGELTHTVQYSSDGGDSWKPLAVGLRGNSFQTNRSSLPGSDEALIRVSVSDGVHTAVDTSDPFQVLNNAPSIYVFAPWKDNVSFNSLQSVMLQALVIDPEEGMLSGDQIVWRSDFAGVLGTGQSFMLPLADLAKRVHLITATATDSLGGSALDTRTLGFGIEDDESTTWIVDFLSSLDERAFVAPGLRTAILSHLVTINKSVEEQKTAPATRQLENLVRHSDGCSDGSAVPDRDDWFVNCEVQQQFLRQLEFLRERLDSTEN